MWLKVGADIGDKLLLVLLQYLIDHHVVMVAIVIGSVLAVLTVIFVLTKASHVSRLAHAAMAKKCLALRRTSRPKTFPETAHILW
jgi:uncharacterized membrane protein